jgi:hypothetical protein
VGSFRRSADARFGQFDRDAHGDFRQCTVESGIPRGVRPSAAILPLRRRHGELQQLLQLNMTVLATAHAVSEGIIRGVSGELAKTRTPSTCGASGWASAPNPRAGQPLAISRAVWSGGLVWP